MSLVLCGALISQTYIPPQPISAFSAETTIDINTSITEAEIKDTTLLSVLRVIANYTKAQKNNSSLPDLTGNEDLLSNTYAPYQYSSFTFGDLSSYTGVINLTPYGDLITSIEGLGYARGASEFNLGNCTKITSIPDNEFGKCSVESIILSNKVTSIGKGAFQQCTKLSRVVIDGINYADEEAGTLLDVRYITKIGDYAFDGCYKLDNVTLYSGSREVSIGASAFSNCTSLRASLFLLPMQQNLERAHFLDVHL